MFLLTRRQAHAALAGAGAALAYLAAAEVGSRKPVRVGGLVILSSMTLAGLMTAKSSVKSRNTEARLNNFFNNGGSVGGDFVVNGDHTVTGDITGGGHMQVPGNISNAISGGTGNINTNGDVNAGGDLNVGAVNASGSLNGTNASLSSNLNMNGNNINDIGTLSPFGSGIAMGGNLNMSGNDINSASSIAAAGASLTGNLSMNNNNINGIGNLNPSTTAHRADLGAGATLPQVQARCDFLNDSLVTLGLLS